MTLFGPYLVSCGLLIVAGTAKALRPGDTVGALAPWVPGLAGRTGRAVVRVVALAEVALGLVALCWPHRSAALGVAVSYAAFAVVVAVVRYRGGALASCGCFGRTDTPATVLHLVVDVTLAVSAAAVSAAAPAGNGWQVLAGQPGHGLPLVMIAALGAWVVVLALGRLAVLGAARAELAGRPRRGHDDGDQAPTPVGVELTDHRDPERREPVPAGGVGAGVGGAR